jgi:superfamily II DNA/RNA helicase
VGLHVLLWPPTGAAITSQILVPTKELCDQTYRVLSDLSYFCRDTVTIQVTPSGVMQHVTPIRFVADMCHV